MDGVTKHGPGAGWVVPGGHVEADAEAPFLDGLAKAKEFGYSVSCQQQ